MNMKRSVLFIIFIFLLTSTVSGATAVTKPGDTALISAEVSLSSILTADIGFYPYAKTPEGVITTNPDFSMPVSSFNINIVDDTRNGYLKSEPICMYWKILGNAGKKPQVSLKMSGPLTSTSGSKIDWKVTWSGDDTGSISSNVMPLEKVVYSSAADVAPIAEGRPLLRAGTFKRSLVAETLNPFWDYTPDTYIAQLWIMIRTTV